MKTKMLKKLASIVCAVAMATSCTVVSVGAAPSLLITQMAWEQGYNRAIELNNIAHAVFNNGHSLADCNALADELQHFFNGTICTAAVSASHPGNVHGFAGNVSYVLNHLRSTDLEQRELGLGAAIDNLYDVAGFIQEQMH